MGSCAKAVLDSIFWEYTSRYDSTDYRSQFSAGSKLTEENDRGYLNSRLRRPALQSIFIPLYSASVQPKRFNVSSEH